MFTVIDSHRELVDVVYEKLDCEGYVSILGSIRQIDKSKQLVAQVPSSKDDGTPNCNKEFILFEKKTENEKAYTQDGFCALVFKLVKLLKKNTECKLFPLVQRPNENENMFFCILYFDLEVELINITSITEFLAKVYAQKPQLEGLGYNQYYRGQIANWRIVPSLFRKYKWVEEEAKLNAKICSDRPSDFSDCRTQFERLVRLKHYNQPSRLLDLSKSPLVGLYFSCEYAVNHPNQFAAVHCCFSNKKNEKFASLSDSVEMLTSLTRSIFRCKYPRHDKGECPQYPSLYMGNYMQKNCLEAGCQYVDEIAYQFSRETSVEFDEMELDKLDMCIIVHPPMNNHRIVQQQGLFIMCGRNQNYPYKAPEALGDFFKLDGKRLIFLIHPEDIETIKKQLSLLGINEYYIYGDLEKEIKIERERISGFNNG